MSDKEMDDKETDQKVGMVLEIMWLRLWCPRMDRCFPRLASLFQYDYMIQPDASGNPTQVAWPKRSLFGLST